MPEYIQIKNLIDGEWISEKFDSTVPLFRVCREYGFEPRVVQRAFNAEGVFGLIACGMGVTVQPECMGVALRKGLTIRQLVEDVGSVPIIAVWNNTILTPAKKHFIEAMRDYVAQKS